ncbi:hypothetical protein ACQ4M3_09755 [Leptolyngbya sp. AN03gr2]|uniref:hypothetical protein n=1 Tax=Leptolyngbya sp. AN03gr2 TaxID=3423364 RepID=UPI003D316344
MIIVFIFALLVAAVLVPAYFDYRAGMKDIELEIEEKRGENLRLQLQLQKENADKAGV